MENLLEVVSGALANKNPNVKAETAAFLARSFCYCTPAVINKKLVKALATDLLKTLNESGKIGLKINESGKIGLKINESGKIGLMVEALQL